MFGQLTRARRVFLLLMLIWPGLALPISNGDLSIRIKMFARAAVAEARNKSASLAGTALCISPREIELLENQVKEMDTELEAYQKLKFGRRDMMIESFKQQLISKCCRLRKRRK